MGEKIRRCRRYSGKVMVVDGAGVKVKGRSSGVVAVAMPEESNAEQVREWLKLVKELGVAVVESDGFRQSWSIRIVGGICVAER